MFTSLPPWNLVGEIKKARDAASSQKTTDSKTAAARSSIQKSATFDSLSEKPTSRLKIDVKEFFSQNLPSNSQKEYCTIHPTPFAQSSQTIIKTEACATSFLAVKDQFQNRSSENIYKLKQLGIPLKESDLQHIYKQIDQDSSIFFDNPQINYPALFALEMNGFDKTKSWHKEALDFPPFLLEIHATWDVFLLMLNHRKTKISSGSAKRVIKAFRLNDPKIYAYALSLGEKKKKQQKNEERFLTLFATSSRIVKVISLHYYGQRQSILMRYCPQDLFTPLSNLLCKKIQLSKQIKLNYTLQLLEGIQELHKKNVVHRDLKPENILVKKDGQTLQLTDFGLACLDTREELKNLSGTPLFLAPEGWSMQFDAFGKALDIWSAGCVFWLLWKEEIYPWYRYDQFNTKSSIYVLEAINHFHQTSPSPYEYLDVFIWHMLHPIPEERWTVEQCIEYFTVHGKDF